MKIGYVLGGFPVLSESFILNEIVELIKTGHEVHIFSLGKPLEGITHNEVDGYNLSEKNYFFKYSLLIEGLKSVLNFNFFKLFSFKETYLDKCSGIARANFFSEIIKGLEIDVLHSHFSNNPTFVNMCISKLTKIPFTFTCHAYDIFVNPDVKALRERMKNASAIMAISYYNRNFLHNLAKIEANKIFVIRACPNISKLKNVKRNEDDFTILTIARLVEKKGIKYGILAVKKLLKLFPEIKYRIVGSGPLERELRDIVHFLHLENNIRFLGNLDDKRLLDEFSRATVFILPCVKAENGDMDGIPVSLMEAMYMQIPVISTAISGIPELIENGKEGLLTEPKNIEQFSSALRILLEDKNLRRKIGAKGRKKVESEFNVHQEVAKLIDIWETVTKL